MKKKDILGLIGTDITRKRDKKPKKRLDDYLVGDEDKHEKVMRESKKPEERAKKKNSLVESVGAGHGEEKANKPTIELLDFGSLNKMAPKEQIKNLKREYLNLIDKLEEISGLANNEQLAKNAVQIELQKYKREIKLVKDFLREVVGYIPDAHDLKVRMDTTEWSLSDVEMEMTSKVKSLVNKVKFAEKAAEEELKEIAAQKKALENELYSARNRIEELESNPTVVYEIPDDGQEVSDDEIDVVENETEEDEEEKEEKTVQTKTSPFEKKPISPPEKREHSTSTRPQFKSEVSGGNKTTTPPAPAPIPEAKPKVEEDDLPKYVFMDVDRYIENLPENGKFVLEVIGRTGISRNSELKKHIEETEVEEAKKHFYSGGKFDYNQLSSAVKLLKDRQFLNSQEVNLGARGHKFPVYDLSDIGKAVYYKSTQIKPVEPESAQILRDHKSLEHGYLIKDCAVEFRAMGYEVYEDREHCTYNLKNGKRKVFDLIIEKDGEKKHIEVERGTHSEDDFLTAMDKIYEVTSDFYFIAPNQKILYTNTKGKVFKWITDRLGGFEKAKGKIRMNFATFENLKKRQKQVWEEFKL